MRINVQRRVVHPTNPRIVVPVADERGWIFGPGEGRWWRWFAWWVIPIGLALLVGPWLGWNFHPTTPLPTPAATPTRTTHRPTPVRRPTKPSAMKPAPPAPTVDLRPVREGLAQVADAVRDLRAEPPERQAPAEAVQPQRLDEYGQPASRPAPCIGLDPGQEARCRLWNQQ